MIPVMLSVAGSDPSGGAGIQADLKTAAALRVYGAAVITSLTAQNTTGVSGISAVPAAFVAEQYESVVSDVRVHALKIGMLGTTDVVDALADAISENPIPHIVLDPVMVAASGDRLVSHETVYAIRKRLLPLATLTTPNLPEAGALLDGPPPHNRESMFTTGSGLRELGTGAALVKGGHLGGDTSDDILVDADGRTEFTSPRVATTNTHGTGCTLSSAIACFLALGLTLRESVCEAKSYLTGALRGGVDLQIGAGNGPVDHLWKES